MRSILSDRRALIALATAGSAGLLGGAFVFQALGYAPCHLCLLQRWPHAAAIALGLIALFALPRLRLLPWLGALATLATAALGAYHTGVERQWWAGPTDCTGQAAAQNVSAADLLNQIMAAPLIRCDEVAWSLFGLSMASWNVLASLALTALWLRAALRD